MTSPTATLEEMCELIIDCPHFTPEWTDSGFIVIRNQNIRDGRLDLSETSFTNKQDFERRIKRAKPRAGDIIFTREAPMGEVCMVPEGLECCVGQRQVLLRPAAGVDGRYLFFALRSEFVRHQILWNEGTGSTVSNVRIPILKALKIPRLGNAEQYIGAILGSLDDKIELNRRMNKTLEAMVQATFRDWFVDFGPTRRKIEGATDPVEVMGGLVANTERARELAELFPASIGASGLPKGWEQSPFSEFVEIIGGGTPKTTNNAYWNGSIPWFSVVDTPPGSSVFVFETEKTITAEGMAESSARPIRPGTTIISARGTVGNLAVAAQEMTFNQSCYGLQGRDGVGDCYVFVASQQVVERLRSMAHGSVFSTITRQTFDGVSLPRVSRRCFSAFEEVVGPLFERIKANGWQNRTLADTRDLLLPKLMSGEVAIQMAEVLA